MGRENTKCTICKNGETRPEHVTVALQRGETTIVIEDVPAGVCDNCGEYYLTEKVTGDVLRRAEESVGRGVEVEILRFAA